MNLKQFWFEMTKFLRLISDDNKKVYPVMLFGGFSSGAIPFLGLFFSARILNQIIAGDYDACFQNAVILIISQFIFGTVEKACSQAVNAMRENCENSVKQRMASKAFELEYEKFEKQETMDEIRRADISSTTSGGIGNQVLSAYAIFGHLFSIAFSVILICLLLLQVDNNNSSFLTSYAATPALLLAYGLILVLCKRNGNKLTRIFEWAANEAFHVNSLVGYLQGVMLDEKNAKDIRVFQMQSILINKYTEFFKKCVQVFFDSNKKRGFLMGVNSLLAQFGAGLTYLFVGAKAFYGVIDVGDVLLYAGAVNRAFGMVISLFSEMTGFMHSAAYIKTYDDFINRPSMSYDGTLPIEKRDDAEYLFEFHDVSFSYPGASENVLSHVSLKFQIGKSIALVGRNGAGKTTLIKLLCRLYEPSEGVITLNGIDIRKYNYQEYTRAFSVVFQDFHLFSLPLDENVTSGDTPEEGRIWEVLDEVDLKERVEGMNYGLHSRLYNNNGTGIDISGGEAQRLAIARALYKDAPFVILDEPTAALDPIAEAEIYGNFNQMIRDKTAIYISHRMSSCKFCDRIVVLDQGAVAETGTHDQLLELRGIYSDLYEMQAQYYA